MRFLSGYFTTSAISLGFLASLTGSAFIYLHHFGLFSPWIQTPLALLTLALWLRLSRFAMFWGGFFTGIFWFWWIALSFRYYDLAWMIPFVVVAVGGVYGIVMGLLGALPHPFLRAPAVGALEYLHPFGFDWFRPALLFVDTPLGERLWQFWTVLAVLTIVLSFKSRLRYLAFLALFAAIYRPPHHIDAADLNTLANGIELVETTLPQDKKWDPRYLDTIVQTNFKRIERAAEHNKTAVILPESAFPLFLNQEPPLVRKLLKLSRKITILTGALYYDRRPYNSAYLFQNGKMRIMHKVVPVPFGEANPLPKWLGGWINAVFFEGAEDYAAADTPSDFFMAGRTWRNAICYEATSERLFAGDPPLMAAMSNNAWFLPSTQPTLQRLLMQLEADRHGTVIFHAANLAGTGIVRPRPSFF